MSILKTMYSAASGLLAHAQAISVASDNIANVNTVGFKSQRARFEDVLGSTVAGAVDNQTSGQGVRLGGVHTIWTQGSMIGSRNNTDMAIQGDGFFVVQGAFDGVQNGKFYSRDGQFNIDNAGMLVNTQGLQVQGYIADQDENISSTLSSLEIPLTKIVPPKQTDEIVIGANLSPQASSDFIGTFNKDDPENTSHFSTSVTVYDSLGVGHNVNVFFNQTATGSWEWNALANGAELADPANVANTREAEGNVVLANGTITFDSTTGLLDTESQTTQTFHFYNADPSMAINIDFGDSITTDGGTGLGGVTQFDASSSVSDIRQNGYASGALAGVNVDLDGKIVGTFTNGERRVLAAVALARFVNNDGLIRRDGGHYAASPDSGQALVGRAGTGGRGSIVGNNLEQSTVELAEQFVSVISYQRGFQANSRSISTADDLLQEAVNLKR